MSDKKILIVDFDTESLIALSNLVYEEGFQAETATDGLAAYEKFLAGHFDLVILEPMLPKLHGFELCKRIVNDPERKAPVIIVTAIYREPSCRHDALNHTGASAFFTKPYNRDELRAKMLQLLVGERETVLKRVDEPAAPAAPARTAVPAQAAAGPAGPKAYKLNLEDLLEAKPVPRETKTIKSSMDIEKELQAAVSDVVGPPKKKDPVVVQRGPDLRNVKDEFRQLREKREPKGREDSEIDALLKDAISGLAGPPKKKGPEVRAADRPSAPATETPRPGPAVRPVAPARPETRTGPPERIPVADEIRQRLPFQPGKPNNIPRASSPADIGRTAVPFDIDRALIEIDKIPLEDIKPPRDEDRGLTQAVPGAKKGALFEEFSEPARKRPQTAAVAAAAAALVLAASAGFLVLRPKRHGAVLTENVTKIEEPQLNTAALRSETTKPYPDTAEAELKSEPKRPAKPAPEPPAEIGAPIQPEMNPQGTVVRLQEPPPVNPATPADTPSKTAAEPESSPLPQTAAVNPETAPAAPAETLGAPPSAEKARPGALYALDQVNAGPVLIKKVEPKYPPLALRSGASGTVTVNALISENGDVLRTEILRGIKNGFGLETAAEDAVRLWKFTPAIKDNVRVRVWKSFDITFKPGKKNP